MKKLLIAMAVAATAVVSQAASVSWTAASWKTPASADGGFSTTAAKATVSGSLYILTQTQYNTFLAAYAEDGNMKSVYDYFTTGAGKDTAATKTGTSASFTSTLTMSTTADVGDTVYGAVIYTTTATFNEKPVDFYVANIATGTVGSDAGVTIANLGTYYLGVSSGDSAVSTGGWQAVPEPTSGLLMLLGMAGLALRRKRV